MHKGLTLVGLCVAGVIVLHVAGCGGGGGGAGGGGKTTIPECGFSMELPSGWTTESYAQTEFYKRGDRDNSWGMAKFCPLRSAARTFEDVSEFVKHLIEEERFQGTLKELISERALKVGEVQADAHEAVFRDTNGNYVLTLFIEMENKEALQVYFQVPANQFEAFRNEYRSAIDSIHLTKKKAEWGT
jgi:hypothetical protein